MLGYIARRLLLFVPTLLLVSLVVFWLIQLPPGDYVSSVIAVLEQGGQQVDEQTILALKNQYGVDQPFFEQYVRWIGKIVLHGDFGYSLAWNQPVVDLMRERLLWTVAVSLCTLVFTWVVAFPIGIYSATHQYSIPDYIATFIGFVGRGVPDFMLALILIWVGFSLFGVNVGGLFSREYQQAPWSLSKVLDLLKHLWVPLVVLGTSGTAGLIRILRANLLDELHKPYVMAARAKGMKYRKLIWKYPVRIAINPFVSSIGYMLPALVSGSAIVSIVLALPTTGPLLLGALQNQDMYLAGSFLLMLSSLTVLGTLISDILLAWVDPRVRLGQ